MKKIYLLAVICCITGFMEMFAYDFTAPDVNGNSIYYNYIGGDSVEVTYHSTDYASYFGEIVLPSIVSNGTSTYRVTRIGQNAFKSSSVTKLDVPETINELTPNAFAGNKNTILELSFNHLKNLPSNAFSGLGKLQKLHVLSVEDKSMKATVSGCCDLVDIKLPRDIKEINSKAFNCCLLLKELQLPDSITTIPNGSFNACWNLRHITIPKGVVSIGDEAFKGCIWLKSITIPKSVQTIGQKFICGTALGPYEYSYMDHYGGYTIDGGLYPGSASDNQLHSIFFEGLVPPAVTQNTFSLIIKDKVTCYVPEEALEVYKADSLYLNAFKEILGYHVGESNVEAITENTATLKWLPDSLVVQYDINVYQGETHFAHYVVDGNGQIVSSQRFAPSIYKQKLDTTVSSTDYFVITLDGLDSGTDYTYTIDGIDAQSAPIYHEEGAFTTMNEGEEGFIDAIADDPRKQTLKIFKDGQIYILRNGRIYNLNGTEMK